MTAINFEFYMTDMNSTNEYSILSTNIYGVCIPRSIKSKLTIKPVKSSGDFHEPEDIRLILFRRNLPLIEIMIKGEEEKTVIANCYNSSEWCRPISCHANLCIKETRLLTPKRCISEYIFPVVVTNIKCSPYYSNLNYHSCRSITQGQITCSPIEELNTNEDTLSEVPEIPDQWALINPQPSGFVSSTHTLIISNSDTIPDAVYFPPYYQMLIPTCNIQRNGGNLVWQNTSNNILVPDVGSTCRLPTNEMLTNVESVCCISETYPDCSSLFQQSFSNHTTSDYTCSISLDHSSSFDTINYPHTVLSTSSCNSYHTCLSGRTYYDDGDFQISPDYFITISYLDEIMKYYSSLNRFPDLCASRTVERENNIMSACRNWAYSLKIRNKISAPCITEKSSRPRRCPVHRRLSTRRNMKHVLDDMTTCKAVKKIERTPSLYETIMTFKNQNYLQQNSTSRKEMKTTRNKQDTRSILCPNTRYDNALTCRIKRCNFLTCVNSCESSESETNLFEAKRTLRKVKSNKETVESRKHSLNEGTVSSCSANLSRAQDKRKQQPPEQNMIWNNVYKLKTCAIYLYRSTLKVQVLILALLQLAQGVIMYYTKQMDWEMSSSGTIFRRSTPSYELYQHYNLIRPYTPIISIHMGFKPLTMIINSVTAILLIVGLWWSPSLFAGLGLMMYSLAIDGIDVVTAMMAIVPHLGIHFALEFIAVSTCFTVIQSVLGFGVLYFYGLAVDIR